MPEVGHSYPRWIQRSLVTGGGFAFVCLLAAAMWKLFSAMGDSSGAAGARSVTIVAALCWGASFVVLVILLACDRIFRENEDPG